MGFTSDAPSIMLDLIPLHANLMRSNDGLQPIALTEPFRNIGTKLEPYTPLTRASPGRSLGIRPEHLHHQPLLPGLSLLMSIQLPHIIKGNFIIGEETSVEDEVLRADQSGQWESAEGLGEELKGSLVVFGFALAFETVHAVHIVCFVVAAVQEEVAGVEKLV